MIGKDHFHFRTFGAHQVHIVFHIIHAGKFMYCRTKEPVVFFQCQHICIGIYPRLINLIPGQQMIADLVGRIAQHQNNFSRPPGNAPETNGKTVTG